MESRSAVVIGLDVGKTAHHACALDPDGNKLFDKASRRTRPSSVSCSLSCRTTAKS